MGGNVLITGSSGFVGRHFIKNASEFNLHEIDLLKKKSEEIDFSNIDSVLHLAAIVHQMKGGIEKEYFRVNRDLAFEVAKQAKAQGVKQFILMSTAKVFGESTTGTVSWNEKSQCFPKDAYGKSKWEAENLIRDLETGSFKVVIIRSPLVYGEGVRANMLNLIKLIVWMPIVPLGGIKNSRSLVYIGNLVALMKLIIQKQASGIFIAGDRVPLSTTQLIIFIAKSLNKRIRLIKMPNFVVNGVKLIKPSIIDRLFGSLELDNSNTNEVLQFTPPFSTEQGISEMVNWYLKSYKKTK